MPDNRFVCVKDGGQCGVGGYCDDCPAGGLMLCAEHGVYAVKGCAFCDADIDALTMMEPPKPRIVPEEPQP